MYFQQQEAKTKKQQQRAPASSANFLFAAHESVPAEELFLMLREKHIYVRYFKSPRINNYLRITIGTPEQMEIFLAEVEKYLASK